MATGQVRGEEPRPISTSRQPVLPLIVSNRPAFVCGSRNLGVAFHRGAGFFRIVLRGLGRLGHGLLAGAGAIDAGGKNVDPAGSVFGLVGAAIEADDFGATQPASKTDRQNGLVAQPAQIVFQGRQHGQEIVGENGFLLRWRAAMGAADAGEHGGDMRIADIQRLAHLPVAPANSREPPLKRGDGHRFPAATALHAGGQIQPDGPRIRGRNIEPGAAQPGRKLPPVGFIGALGVL